MNIEQPSHQSAPLLKGSEEQVVKLRKRLEDVFRNVSLAHDVVAICIELSEGNTGDFNPEMAHVLRRCAAERLHFQMEVLTRVIERLGGTTAFSNVVGDATANRTGKRHQASLCGRLFNRCSFFGVMNHVRHECRRRLLTLLDLFIIGYAIRV